MRVHSIYLSKCSHALPNNLYSLFFSVYYVYVTRHLWTWWFLVTACHLFNETSTTGSLLPHVRLHEVWLQFFADPPNSLGLLSLPHSLSKSPCLLNSTLCRPHVHTHRVAQAGAKPPRLADWTHVKFLIICASRWPLVLVGSDSTFLSAFLTCSSRCFCAVFPCGDLPSAPPPFASLWAAFRFTESVEAIRKNCHPLSAAQGPAQASVPTLIFPPLTVGRLPLFLAQALLAHVHPLLCLLKYSGTPLQQLFPTLLCHQIFPQIGLASHGCFISFCHITAKLPEIVVC